MQMDELKRKFLEDALLANALRDCLPMANSKARRVFKQAPPDSEKDKRKEYTRKGREFKDALKSELRRLAKNYISRDVDDVTHVRTIRGLAHRLTQGHAEVLNGDKLYFGIAHKALNVYLKYLWCADPNVRPPHCPFDNGIIVLLKPGTGIEHRWSFCNKAPDYCKWVSLAREAATKKGYDPNDIDALSKWETEEWDAIQTRQLQPRKKRTQ